MKMVKKHNNKVAVVIPTIRDLDFLKAWGREFEDCIGIIIEDRREKTVKVPKRAFRQIYHYSWEDIEKELKESSWIIPRKNAGIRNYGFLKAYELGTDTIITLDDDCYPVKNQVFLNEHLENLEMKSPHSWIPTYPHREHVFTRGFPYRVRDSSEVVISHGIWRNILDHDAQTQLKNPNLSIPASFPFVQFIPRGYFYPMCSMNLAFKTKIAPIMYFPPMGSDDQGRAWGFDRFDDIWAGIFSKKILDHIGYAVVNGSPFVDHKRASNVYENLKKEKSGIAVNENLFESVSRVNLKSATLRESYVELARKVDFPKTRYFEKLKTAMKIWAGLYAE